MSAIKRLRASLIVMLGVIMAVAGFAAPATAAPYSHHATTSVSSSHPTAGSTITFCGAGFLAGERVTITLDRTRYPSVTASSSGTWCTPIALSSRLSSGKHTLTATGTTSHRSSSTRIHVQARHHGDPGDHGNWWYRGDSGDQASWWGHENSGDHGNWWYRGNSEDHGNTRAFGVSLTA